MIGLRHNPYVGSFHHGINDFTRIEHNSCANDESNSRNFESQIMSESKNNPLIGIFRHSPSQTSQKSLGLKGIIYSEKAHKPANMLSQLQVSKESRSQAKENFLISLRQIPSKVFSISSRSSSENSPLPAPDGSVENEGRPVCSICIEPYEDGDELLTLACSHCFHSDCVSEWFYQGCVERDGGVDPKSFNCPECRQDHFLSSDRNSNSASQPNNSDIVLEIQPDTKLENSASDTANTTATTAPIRPSEKDAISFASEKEKQGDGSISHGNHLDRSTLQSHSNGNKSSNFFATTLHGTETKSVLSDSVDDNDIPTTAFVYIGKKIAEKEGGYDFLSDAGSEDYSHSFSVVDSPLSTPSSRTAPSGFQIVPLTIQQQAKAKPSTFPPQSKSKSKSTRATSSAATTTTTTTAVGDSKNDNSVNVIISSSSAALSDGLRETVIEEDGDGFVTVGSGSGFSDCGRPLRWK